MKGLVLAPHSNLIFWNELNLVMKHHDIEHELDGFTFVKSDCKFYNKVYYIKEEELTINVDENYIFDINRIISRDRWLRNLNYNTSLKICNNIYNILDKLFDKVKYNFLVGEVSCATNEIALILSFKYNIKFINITASIYKDRYFMYVAKNIFGNNYIIKEKIKNFNLDEFSSSSNSEVISNLYNKKSYEYNYKSFVRNMFYNIFKAQSNYFSDQHNNLIINFQALLRIFFKSDRFYYKNLQGKETSNYFLFYLHYEPDLSTYIWANNYLDQLYLLSIISRNLPFGTKIIVKEHPLSKLLRPREFYKKLNKIPNIYLVDASVDSLFLISNSIGVISITGSVGYEAWLLGKPVIVFGDVFYDGFNGVIKCRDFDQILSVLGNFIHYSVGDDELKLRKAIDNFIKDNCTFEGSIFSYENHYNTLSNSEKINNMTRVFEFIRISLNEAE